MGGGSSGLGDPVRARSAPVALRLPRHLPEDGFLDRHGTGNRRVVAVVHAEPLLPAGILGVFLHGFRAGLRDQRRGAQPQRVPPGRRTWLELALRCRAPALRLPWLVPGRGRQSVLAGLRELNRVVLRRGILVGRGAGLAARSSLDGCRVNAMCVSLTHPVIHDRLGPRATSFCRSCSTIFWHLEMLLKSLKVVFVFFIASLLSYRYPC